ncbi:Stk1 family PASTA domain-containing Ser/Thr kinase [Xylanimonas sp. McL0601]|uniref:Stk1 family PASTA domain-containing Ser/Thr kinase n=1 Tax=Xylanimonas sp. McL0601 TaxID=3414739 RepID=UPI003CF91600
MAIATTDPLLGRLVDGRYEIRARIARGGMATVYLALDRRLDREVALKVMHAHLAEGVDGAAFVSRFRREARAAARLTHPGVVAVYDQGLDGETSYLTMEYVPGSNLRRELRSSATVSVGRTLDLLGQVLAALAAAHGKGLVHRDVKPENVLIAADDGSVKVADFGLARAVTEVTSTTTGTILGTVAYLAPEVIATGACDARTDVYAVGILAYEMLTGALPHAGTTPIQVAFQHVHDDVPPPSARVPWLPARIDDLVAAFTARDPAARPADGAAALALLRRVRLALESVEPDVLERRAAPPDGFVGVVAAPATERDDDAADVLDSAEGSDSLDGGGLDAIPFAGAFAATVPAAAAAGLDVWFPGEAGDGTPTEQLVEQPTTRVGAGDEMTAPVSAPTPDAPAPASRRRWPRVLGWVLGLAVVLGGAAYGTWWWFEDGPGAWTTVPLGLEDAALTDAKATLAAHGLAATTTKEHDDDVPEGSVVSSDPGSGERVRKDGSVELVVSLGIRMVTVPDGLVGATEDDATAALRGVGLPVGDSRQVWSDTAPVGQVVSASEDAKASVPHNTVITLTVSGGPAPATVTQQVGREKADAKAALEALGFHVGFTPDEASETVPAGRVIRQSPESGAQAHRLDTVMLTVSSGPPIVDVPDVVGMRTAEATDALTKAGFKVDANKYLGGLLDTVRFQDKTGTAPKGSTVTLTIW